MKVLLGEQSGAPPSEGFEVRALSGSCGNHEDWFKTMTYEETCRRRGGRCYFQSTLGWIFDNSRRSLSNER